jgi:hypothetical protein
MKNKLILGFCALLVLGFVLAGCSNMAGSWEGTVFGYDSTVEMPNAVWKISMPHYDEMGVYDKNGKTGNLHSNSTGKVVGTAILNDGNTLILTFNSDSLLVGTHVFKRSK